MPPGPTSARALSYQARLAQNRAAPKQAAMPAAIPRLDGSPPEGVKMTMEQLGRIQQGEESGWRERGERPAPPPLGLLPTDQLPEEARLDPEFRSGVGDMMAVNQPPSLARKYGILRDGKRLRHNPQAVQPQRPAGGGLSPETKEGLSRMAEDMQRNLGRVEVPPVEHDPPASVASQTSVSEALGDLDSFDLQKLKAQFNKDDLNNDEQRAIIEARLKPLSLSEIIASGTVWQKVPVIPGEFEPIFEHVSGETNSALKALVGRRCIELDLGQAYFEDLYSLYQLAAGVKGIGNVLYEDYRDSNGDFVEAKFFVRFKQVARNIAPVLASLGANWLWFDRRVRKLLQAKNVKNG